MSHSAVSPTFAAARESTAAATPSQPTGLVALLGPLEEQRNASKAALDRSPRQALAAPPAQPASTSTPLFQAAGPVASDAALGDAAIRPDQPIEAGAGPTASASAAGPAVCEVPALELMPRKKTGGGRPLSAVWQHYAKISDASATSKRYEVSCLACTSRFLSRVEQMEQHLAYGCTKCAPEVQQAMRARVAQRANVRAMKEREDVKLQPGDQTGQKRPRMLAMGVPSPGLLPTSGRPAGIPWRLRFPQVYVPSHPLVGHWLAVCRNKASPPPIFRSAIAELGRWLIYEAAQDWLPVVESQVETPMGVAECKFVDPTKPVKVVPILRAGLVLLEQASTVLPSAETYHVGYVRNETTLEASMYLNKLPKRLNADDRVLVCDPMLATGGTMLNVLNDLVRRGASQEYIRIISIVVAPPALNLLSRQYPGLRVYCGMIDEETNDRGMIVPGLGDAGDRAFGTA